MIWSGLPSPRTLTSAPYPVLLIPRHVGAPDIAWVGGEYRTQKVEDLHALELSAQRWWGARTGGEGGLQLAQLRGEPEAAVMGTRSAAAQGEEARRNAELPAGLVYLRSTLRIPGAHL